VATRSAKVKTYSWTRFHHETYQERGHYGGVPLSESRSRPQSPYDASSQHNPRGSSAGPAEALLLETFGSSLLAYLCAVEEEELIARLAGSGELRRASENVLQNELLPIAEHVAAEVAKHPGLPPAYALQVLGNHHEPAGTSVGNALRLAAGGSLPQPPDSEQDAVADILLRLAVDQYPVFLAPSDDPWRSMTISLFGHPLRPKLDTLVTADADLSQLFRDDDPGLGRRGFVYTSLGGFSLQSVMFGEMMLRSAWESVSMSIAQPTLHQLCQEVLRNLDIVRAAARGGTPAVRSLVAFTGITTEGERTVRTPWGDLRPLTDAERRAAPSSLEGAVSGTNPDGKQVTVSYAGEVVLDTELPYSLLAQAENRPDSGTWPKLRGADELGHRLEAIQLSALLAIARPPGSWVSVRPAWTWIADPLTYGRSISWWDPRSAPAFMPYELRAPDCDELSRWCELIAHHRSPAIEIAIRRVISAAHARTAPADRLVDSVIAWENLFGTSEGEPRLRITAAMAWLLEVNPTSRESLQGRLKALYDARSNIVHGGVVHDRVVAEQANDAFGFAVKALGALFRDRPDVLALPDGAARSLRLILGGFAGNESSEEDAS
jgi:hypothetical protein